MPRRTSTLLLSPAFVLVVVLIAANAFWRGGVSAPAAALSAIVAAAALLAALKRGRRRTDAVDDGGGSAIPALVLGLGIVGVWTVAQLVPLPPALLRLLSPEAATLYDRHLGPIGAWPSWRPLSLDPGATALEIAKDLGWTLVVAVGAVFAADRGRRNGLLRAVALAGPAVVLAMFGNTLLANAPLLEPRFPFPNPNHLAGFLQLAAWPALGFALRERGPARAGWLVAFAFTAAGIFLSLSRAGIAAFFVGTGVFVALYVRAGRRRLADAAPARPPWREVLRAGPRTVLRAIGSRSSALLPVAVSTALAIAAYLALDRIISELRTISEASTTEVKLGLWPSAIQVITSHPLTGVGRGAFATVFPAYKWEPVLATFTHVENEFLQLPADLGIFFGIGLMALFAWAWLSAARKDEISRPVIGALAGTAALVAHNTFDFSLEIPGVAIPFAIVMGVFARDMRKVRVPAWVLRAAAIVAAVLAVAGAAIYRAHSPERDAERVAAAKTADEALALAREVLPWHPADWVPPAVVGGLLAGEFRCDEAEPWLMRATERNPTAFAPHLGAGRCYAIRGKRALAKREYRLAFILGDPDALAEAHTLYPGKGELLEVAPDTPDGLVAAARILSDTPEEAREAWRRAWESFSSVPALAGLAAVTLDLGEKDEALALGRKLEELAPHSSRGYLIAARALDAKEDADGALQELELGAARMPGNASVLAELGVHHLKARRFSQAKAVFEKMLTREGPELVWKKLLVARALEGQDRYAEALRAAFDARDAQPDAPAPLEAIARISAKAGRYDEAIQSLETASHKPGKTPEAYADWIDALKIARVKKTVVDMEREEKAAALPASDAAP